MSTALTRSATAGLLIGMLLSVLDQTVVAVALPDIAADLGGSGSMDAVGWIVTSYVLASTATGALYGRISDRFGRRPVFVTAIVVFVVGSALCGLAQTTAQLIAARTFQGVGAGALFVLPTWIFVHWIAWVVLMAAVVIAVVTGVDYVLRAVRLRRESLTRAVS